MFNLLKDTILPYANSVSKNWWVGILGTFAPIKGLMYVTIVIIAIDFITGCAASYKRVNKSGKKWYFRSTAAWLTIYKTGFCIVTLSCLHIIARDVLTPISDSVNFSALPNIFCAMVCGTEIWSFLENAAEISESRVFVWFRKYAANKAKKYDNVISETMDEYLERTQKHDTDTTN